ncbi:MAG: DUF1592 domain-containing protein [Zavarzinella sp.]
MNCCRFLLVLALTASVVPLHADDYATAIQPFMKKYCTSCHNQRTARGELNLEKFTSSTDIIANFRKWDHVIKFIRGGEMPPEDTPQPTIDERNQVVRSIETVLFAEARKQAGDPGVVLPRRLSNSEYNRSIRDLTGVDIRPTRSFPPDPAGGEGFDNTGESLTMSPSLLKKYLQAAQEVSNHLVLKPNGITFAPFEVTSYNERKKLTEQAIIDFYQQHQVNPADYIVAAWRYRYRSAESKTKTVEQWAAEQRLSGKYLKLVADFLANAHNEVGAVQQLGLAWQELPPPESATAIPEKVRQFTTLVLNTRERFGYREPQLIRSNAGNWPINHLYFRDQVAQQRDQCDVSRFVNAQSISSERFRTSKKIQDEKQVILTLRIAPMDPKKVGLLLCKELILTTADTFPKNEKDREKQQVVDLFDWLKEHQPKVWQKLPFGKHPTGGAISPKGLVLSGPTTIDFRFPANLLPELNNKRLLLALEADPTDKSCGYYVQLSNGLLAENQPPVVATVLHPDNPQRQKLLDSAQRLCQVFPNRFFYVDGSRGLAAGFHLVEGFFRDDLPLVNKVLDEQQTAHLNRLWQEMDFVTSSAENLLRGFVWFERSERHVLQDKRFDFLRAEDPRLVKEELLGRFEKVYYEKMGVKLDSTPESLKNNLNYVMISRFFAQVRQGLATHEKTLTTAESLALDQLASLASKAYRKYLTVAEKQQLLKTYHDFRKQGQSVEEALRGTLTGILMSPHFFYIYQTPVQANQPTPRTDVELATRLSLLIWSSVPDEELMSHAAKGTLRNPGFLKKQVRRMLHDPRSAAFAEEFFGQWLRFRDYREKDPINAAAFPGYDDKLREAIYQEPIRLLSWLIQEDRSVLEVVMSDRTFINEALAKHYGMNSQYAAQKQLWRERMAAAGTLPTDQDLWLPIDGLNAMGRGGLLGTAAILTKNSSGERTSPVKRGFWMVHHLLGQHFPPPPADVAQLPNSEKTASKSIRQLLQDHTKDPRCAMCHVHFDHLGVALEGFDPLGRSRTKDLANRPIDQKVSLPGGEELNGIPGLIRYVKEHRQQDYVDTLCRHFLGYALGRSVQLSDQPLLEQMAAELKKNDYKFSVLFETVILSPQFLNKRPLTAQVPK